MELLQHFHLVIRNVLAGKVRIIITNIFMPSWQKASYLTASKLLARVKNLIKLGNQNDAYFKYFILGHISKCYNYLPII